MAAIARALPVLALACALGPAALLAQGAAVPGLQSAPAPAPQASAAPAILEDDPSTLLGLGLAEALTRFGAPSSVGAMRGAEPWQDDVVFVYGTGYSLFLFGDRLWQLRFVRPYAGSLYGLFIGDPADKALSILGQPFEAGSGALVYRMPYKSYPVRLKLILQEDRIVDAYLYRDDF